LLLLLLLLLLEEMEAPASKELGIRSGYKLPEHAMLRRGCCAKTATKRTVKRRAERGAVEEMHGRGEDIEGKRGGEVGEERRKWRGSTLSR
jgi:hypothetical protein